VSPRISHIIQTHPSSPSAKDQNESIRLKRTAQGEFLHHAHLALLAVLPVAALEHRVVRLAERELEQVAIEDELDAACGCRTELAWGLPRSRTLARMGTHPSSWRRTPPARWPPRSRSPPAVCPGASAWASGPRPWSSACRVYVVGCEMQMRMWRLSMGETNATG